MTRLDIFSDPICPWCFIGKANLDRALESNADHPFEVEWHPFQLNPDMPREGVDKRTYLADRFGGAAKLDAIHARLRETAKAAGIDLNPDVPQRIPNTLDAHRVIHWAGLEGRQTAMVSALMRAYWREGRDIGDAGVLAALAGEVGLDAVMIARLLATDADLDVIRARDDHARARGVSAVPTFLIADKYVVSGAQPPELWAQVMAEIGSLT